MPDTYARARATLIGPDGKPTTKYQAYLEHQEAYDTLVRQRDEARAAALRNPMALQNWPLASRAYSDRIDAAMKRWLTLGHKVEVEVALDVVTEHDGYF
jgi:hypothetical protein